MLILLLLSSITYDQTQEVDLIELNTLYDGDDRVVFKQLIYYQWDWATNRYQCVDWRLMKHHGMIPVKRGQYYESMWIDGEQQRRVRSSYFRRSWSRDDPEIEERERMPKDRRRGLIKMLKPKPDETDQ